MTFFNLPALHHTLLVSTLLFTAIISSTSEAYEQAPSLIPESANHPVALYLAGDIESLPKEAFTLAEKIINNPSLYTTTTQAGAYDLLAEIYTQQHNINKATRMAKKGLTLKNVELTTQLHLSLKVAVSYFYEENYDALTSAANKIVSQARKSLDKKVYLLAVSYRALGNALTKQYALAYKDISVIEGIINRNSKYAEDFRLIDAVAKTYTALGDYSQALKMRQKILGLRFSLSKKSELAQTYYNLGAAYQSLGLLNDAYNAYWESIQQAKVASNKKGEIMAQLALGRILLLQKEYVEAYQVFNPIHQLLTEQREACQACYFDVTVGLAHANLYTKRTRAGYQLLEDALLLDQGKPAQYEHVEFYRLISLMYGAEGDFKSAFHYLTNYITLINEYSTAEQEKVTYHQMSQAKAYVKEDNIHQSSQLAENYEAKFISQEQTILLLSLLIFLFFASTGMYIFHRRTKLVHSNYEEIERPIYYLESPAKTKQIYKLYFKMSRKYEYPLSIGYIAIDNWQELSLRFNKKILAEINKGIATIINGKISEFDAAGLINQGEYLVLFPHQSLSDVMVKFKQLKEVLCITLFANLGDFPVNICFAIDEPDIQDIDPYLFLSRLSDKAGIEFKSNNI
jgi:tetratricopeptide (TPR) repeat protein